MTNTPQTHSQRNDWPTCAVWRGLYLTLLPCAIFFLSTDTAHANAMQTVLCTIVTIIHDDIGRGIATLAVVMLGIGATLGKTSWGLAMTVAVGVAVIFNASQITFEITGFSGC